MEKSIRKKGEEFKKTFSGINWKLDYSQGGLSKSSETEDNKYSLAILAMTGADKREESIGAIHEIRCKLSVYIKSLEFILKLFGLDSFTSFSIISDYKTIPNKEYPDKLIYKGDKAMDYWDELLPIWSQQYHEEILPQLKRFEDLQELHDYDAQFDIRQSIFSGYKKQKRLVLKKLVSESLYQEYVSYMHDNYQDILNREVLKDRAKMIDRYDKTKQLISYLDTLDVESYLTKKPWQEEYQKKYGSTERSKEKSSIITDQLSMLLIDGQLDTTTLSSILGLTLSQGDNLSASDVMIMDQSGDIYLLQDQDKTILFLSDMTMITTWDWSEISRAHRVLSFMRFEGATMTYQVEYWDHGQCLLSRMESDGLRIQDEGSMQEQYHDSTTLDLIETMFGQMTGRGLNEIYEDQPVTQYTIG